MDCVFMVITRGFGRNKCGNVVKRKLRRVKLCEIRPRGGMGRGNILELNGCTRGAVTRYLIF